MFNSISAILYLTRPMCPPPPLTQCRQRGAKPTSITTANKVHSNKPKVRNLYSIVTTFWRKRPRRAHKAHDQNNLCPDYFRMHIMQSKHTNRTLASVFVMVKLNPPSPPIPIHMGRTFQLTPPGQSKPALRGLGHLISERSVE